MNIQDIYEESIIKLENARIAAQDLEGQLLELEGLEEHIDEYNNALMIAQDAESYVLQLESIVEQKRMEAERIGACSFKYVNAKNIIDM